MFVSVDAAIFSASKQMGIGIVIRGHTYNKHVDGITVLEMFEAMAIRQALLFASSDSFDRVLLKSDRLSVVQRVNSSE